jgi:hypothetical protein
MTEKKTATRTKKVEETEVEATVEPESTIPVLTWNENERGTSSFLPVLKWAHRAALDHGWGGTVLEYGGGKFSTAFLALLDSQGFPTVTLEADPEWVKWLKAEYPAHKVVLLGSDEANSLVEKWWDVVLIDHGQPETWIEERTAALKQARRRAGIVLVHDWHIGPGHSEGEVKKWRYYGWFCPDDQEMHTAICSAEVDVTQADIMGGYVYDDWAGAPGQWWDDVWPN